ncbi:GNAT family N-acetyltransferase [Longirhabdus pacifica]|uniref:GNAT family N-acetyltransferase n=1 Tax=Longirhabdus pacifica TaxID=2305227 RepID=UPI0010088C01|nr:GNAT family protein [Longirhabdus pacifica]
MLKGNHIYIRSFEPSDATELLNLQIRNKSFFETYALDRNEDFYTLATQEKRINQQIQLEKEDASYHYGIFLNESDALIGTINLFDIQRSAYQSAFIGYFLDKSHNGKGYTTEAVKLSLHYAFHELKLHRIEAGVMPHNIRSIRVLEKAGFHKEGIAIKNVKINGKWEDHQVMAIINPLD